MKAYVVTHYDSNLNPISCGIYATRDLAEHIGDLGIPDSTVYDVKELDEQSSNVWTWDDCFPD